ncbi:SLATT domain-containing protein [Aeromonas caviae]|uniref:SLATT domain-containing protein n=1 Tax=Aeromonas caviae TaxID=648 RepID=UPI00191DDDC2|nr:SLATT domain-containing protein [Aeromonas caviae]
MALADNIWWTRKARIQTEKRLLSNAFQSQILLLWYSFFSVSVSIYYLKNPQNGIESISWVVYSVLLLCISGFINGLSFKERASLVKECYESLNSIIHQLSDPTADITKLALSYLITHDPQPASRADMASAGLPRLHAPIQQTYS